MVHNTSSVSDRIWELIASLEDEQFADPSDTSATNPPRTAVSALQVAAHINAAAKAALQPLVDRALLGGATWAQIAKALGLKNASSAHYLYGRTAGKNAEESREEKLDKQRTRVAAMRSAAQKEPMPGFSASEVGRHLGIDRRTVKQRAQRGEIETVTVTSSTGSELVRYLMPEPSVTPLRTND
jgi:hypothetical protein